LLKVVLEALLETVELVVLVELTLLEVSVRQREPEAQEELQPLEVLWGKVLVLFKQLHIQQAMSQR
jgi:hypothetical protein